jgi:transcriptional regulator with XRE-family HTH domain
MSVRWATSADFTWSSRQSSVPESFGNGSSRQLLIALSFGDQIWGLTRKHLSRKIHEMDTKSSARKKISATDLRNLRKLLLVNAFEPAIIGRRIAQARQEAGGMTQEELGDLLGVTTRSVQGYEAGAVIPWKHFNRLEEIFHRPLDWFLDREPPPSTVHQLPDVAAGIAQLERSAEDVLKALDECLARLERIEAAVSPPADLRHAH